MSTKLSDEDKAIGNRNFNQAGSTLLPPRRTAIAATC